MKPSWSADDVRHLLSRIEFSASDQRVEQLISMAPAEAVDLLLAEAKQAPLPPDPEWVRDPWVNTERRYADSAPAEVMGRHGATNRRYREEIEDLRRWWFDQMLTGSCPLREVMTLFWHSHFASSIDKVLVAQAMFHQNDSQRRLALGNFADLLRAMTLDAAMMIYLDLEDSDRASPNENYARELFELFALGIGNYDQNDIREAARALSGWTLDAPAGTELPNRSTDPSTNRRFTRDGLIARLDPALHDDSIKTLFGKMGQLGLEDVVRLTVDHPACGPFLAAKLIDFFAVPDRGGELRGAMAEQFVASGGEIEPILRVLLTSEAFYAPETRGSLVKSPVHLIVGACRQLHAEAELTPALNRYLAAMGQELFSPPNVKGWPGGEVWIGSGTLALRYHLADVLLDSKSPPGMTPMGRERGRPIPLPQDPQRRAEMLRQMEQPVADGAPMSSDVMMAVRDRATSGKLELGFTAQRFLQVVFPAGLPESEQELAAVVSERLLGRPPRETLLQAAIAAAQRASGEQAVMNVIRLVLDSPDYQLA
jgi:uncharacterized protein (DUF1800 family)